MQGKACQIFVSLKANPKLLLNSRFRKVVPIFISKSENKLSIQSNTSNIVLYFVLNQKLTKSINKIVIKIKDFYQKNSLTKKIGIIKARQSNYWSN